MGITKRRKQPHLFREGARHQAGDSHLDTARPDVQRAAVHSMIAHGTLQYGMVHPDDNEFTDWDDSTDEPTTSETVGLQSLQHHAPTSDQQDDSAPKPQ